MDALDKVDRLNDSLPVGVIIDDDPEYAKDFYDLLDALRVQIPRVRSRISAITFGDDNHYPALQMADMIAFESRALGVRRIKDKDAQPTDLHRAITKGGIHSPRVWTASDLDEAAKIPPRVGPANTEGTVDAK
jgi:hypothetical protein